MDENENQIMNELKIINKSIQTINERLETVEENQEKPHIIWDIIRSLLIGVFIIGPIIAIVVVFFQVLGGL